MCLRVLVATLILLLAAAPAGSAAGPPDHGLIAFVRDGDIWTVPAAGGAPARLTFTGDNAWPAWSPDGRQIAFDSMRAGSWDVWVMNADGSGTRQVTIATSAETHPTWSPDGQWIAFSSDRDSRGARTPLAARAGGGAGKSPMQGLTRPQATSIQASHLGVMGGITVYLNWRDLQSAGPDTLSGGDVAKVDNALAWAAAAGKTVKIRLFTGAAYGATGETAAPDWLVRQVGAFSSKNSRDPGPVTEVARFWKEPYLQAYDRLMQLMAARWDANPTLRDITISGAMTRYAEPFIRDLGSAQNRAELVGGGVGWEGKYIAPPGAGYSDALNQAAHRSFIDSHARWWLSTASSLAFNPYQVLKSEAEAHVSYTHDNQVRSANNPELTRAFIDYFKAKLGDRGVLENNSVRDSYFTFDAAGHATGLANTGYRSMYEAMRAYGPPSFYQTAQNQYIGSFNRTLDGVINVLKGNAVEPPGDYGALAAGSPPEWEYSPDNFAGINRRLIANPVPGNSGPGGGGGGGGSTGGEGDPYSSWFGHDEPLIPVQSALFKLRSTVPYGIAIRLTSPAVNAAGAYEQDLAPSWSPRGDRIMFTRRSPSPGERSPASYGLFSISSDGGGATEMSTGPGNAWLGAWGPWARTYAWSSDAASRRSFAGPLNVAMLARDGSVQAATTPEGRMATGAPAWSPDGARIAFVRAPAGSVAGSIWTVAAAGPARPDLVVADATQPAWQPR
jgi:hypothetical protein